MKSRRYDLLIRNASLFDGTGAAPRVADVAVRGDRIAAVGGIERESAAAVLDAGGRVLAPGFIDVHTHDDFAVVLYPEMPFKVLQGVTTTIVGNCGFGASMNFGFLVGHGTLRHAVMGNEAREPTERELDRMRKGLREGLEAGALGLSTGLIYEPGRYAGTNEIVALASELPETGGLYATHMRNEADGLLDSVRESIEIGERAGVAVQISHHKAMGRPNWGGVRDSLRLIDDARARGLDVTADQRCSRSSSRRSPWSRAQLRGTRRRAATSCWRRHHTTLSGRGRRWRTWRRCSGLPPGKRPGVWSRRKGPRRRSSITV
jgi:N-acyl-D-amino-acid deacylase